VIDSAVTETLLYHEQTSIIIIAMRGPPGSWTGQQPNPFHFYKGVTAVRLPLLQKDPASEHLALYERSRNAFQDFTRETSAPFLSYRSDFRPGSPFLKHAGLADESFQRNLIDRSLLMLPALPEVTASISITNSYVPRSGPRAEVPECCGSKSKETSSHGWLPRRPCTSIFWREAWKYGERAFRYCQHDVVTCLGGSQLLSQSARLRKSRG